MSMKLSSLTDKKLITLNSDLKNRDEIIKALVKQLYENGDVTSEEEFLKAVYEREAISNTGMEDGLALPHGKSSCVNRAAFAVMSTKEIVADWESIDEDNEVRYIFLLAIPSSAVGDLHLDMLAVLMERMSDEKFKEDLFASKTVDEFYSKLDNEVEKEEKNITYTKKIVAVTACPAGIAHTYMAAEALVKAGDALGVKVYVEKQGANGVEDKHTAENLKNADAAIFAVGVAVKEAERFSHLAITKSSVAEPIKNGQKLIQDALKKAESHQKGEYVETASEEDESVWSTVKQSVMTGISYMIPLIVAGGMILAFAVLVSNAFDLGEMYNTKDTWLWLFRQLGGNLLGAVLMPVLSAYMAYSIGDKTALAPGFAAGICANLINGGFLAGMLGGLLAGYITKYMKKHIPAKGTMAGFISFWVYPVLSSTLIGILMFLVVGRPVAWLNNSMIGVLESLQGSNAIVLGAVIGIMVSFDLGGPINKASYAFSVAMMTEGIFMPYAVFASVKMVSGFAVTFATIAAKNTYKQEEIEAGKSTWILALAGITEGAIPFMMQDPLRVILALCSGSAVTGAIVANYGVGLNVPGAGIFSVFMMQGDNPVMSAVIWFFAAVLGAIISAVLLVILRKTKMAKANK